MVLGGAAGAGAGRVLSEDPAVIIGGALAGAAISAVADAFVAGRHLQHHLGRPGLGARRPGRRGDRERAPGPAARAPSGNRVLSSTETSDWKRYRTRVMSKANKVNLEFEEAAPDLVAGLTRSIAGIF